ncbi:rhomboid-domain-containing protein [Mollisia scopiformis]|uniref:Rhomboid-domain-containing protein n=1 Tax=Mollisia scopiformis TaxID=149040 RepID=A0A194WUS2_MOLSC|nr:rhomboid-domain-containing protein [Mollisia scopiformis]KUJ11711.1 rhomboid-domain-containing protein [Mollisia scopiformis]
MSLFSRIVLPSARINLRTSQRLYRPFTSSVLRLNKYNRSPRKTNRSRSQEQRVQQDVSDQYDQNNFEPPPRRPHVNSGKIVVGGIIAACAGVYIYSVNLEVQIKSNFSNKAKENIEWFRKHFVMSYESIQNGRYYTILTSAFNHVSLMHIGFNMIGLWGFGRSIITLFGVPTFGIIFVGAAVTGGIAQYSTWQCNKGYHKAVVGASGAVFGLVTALTFVMPRHSIILGFVPMPMWTALGISVAASIAGLQGVWGPHLGHADHLGGMAFGALFWLLVLRRRPRGWMPYYP